MNPFDIIYHYYTPESPLCRLLAEHSEAVARKAFRCISSRNIDVDPEFVYEAAMLHDIGIRECHAPAIFCRGDLPYICHGVEGRKILESENLPLHALVCERHTGSGLTAGEIERSGLPLPVRDMLPLSTAEQLICYADKFFSKSGGDQSREKPLGTVIREMARFGKEPLMRFLRLHSMYGE